MNNLLILVPGLWLGGHERIAAKTANLLFENYNVTLVVFDGADAVYSTSCNLINLNIPSKSGQCEKIINVLKRAKAIKRICKKLKIDYIYSFGTSANIVNLLIPNVYHLTSLHGFGSTTLKSWEQRLYKDANVVFCVSRVIKNVIDKKYNFLAPKTRVLYNPYDYIMMEDKARDIVDDYFFSSHTIVSHGRLEEVKNWPRLIKAFSIVKKKILDAQLLIIGDGSQRQELENLIESYGLQNSATLLGFRSNPFAYLARSTVYVLSSHSEGFPNSLIEGMVFLPVVAVDCKSGPREILSNGSIDKVTNGYEISDYGVLVQPTLTQKYEDKIGADEDTLADAILEVLQNPVLYKKLKKAAHNRTKEFSCEKYMEKLCDYLN